MEKDYVKIFIKDGNVFIEFENGNVELLENYIYINNKKNIELAPEGSGCYNCFWKKSNNDTIIPKCNAPLNYIGMQVYDCIQYKPIEN